MKTNQILRVIVFSMKAKKEGHPALQDVQSLSLANLHSHFAPEKSHQGMYIITTTLLLQRTPHIFLAIERE